jgi:hypothetical protein
MRAPAHISAWISDFARLFDRRSDRIAALENDGCCWFQPIGDDIPEGFLHRETGSTGFYRVLQGSTGFYGVLQGSWFYWVLACKHKCRTEDRSDKFAGSTRCETEGSL